jgi:hypothetical protein
MREQDGEVAAIWHPIFGDTSKHMDQDAAGVSSLLTDFACMSWGRSQSSSTSWMTSFSLIQAVNPSLFTGT